MVSWHKRYTYMISLPQKEVRMLRTKAGQSPGWAGWGWQNAWLPGLGNGGCGQLRVARWAAVSGKRTKSWLSPCTFRKLLNAGWLPVLVLGVGITACFTCEAQVGMVVAAGREQCCVSGEQRDRAQQLWTSLWGQRASLPERREAARLPHPARSLKCSGLHPLDVEYPYHVQAHRLGGEGPHGTLLRAHYFQEGLADMLSKGSENLHLIIVLVAGDQWE